MKTAVDGVIDYDAQSEASGDKSLWTVREKDGHWVSPPALVQFRSLYVKELK